MTDQTRPPDSHNSTFVRDSHNKSDRAVAIVGAALLKSQLEQLLSAFFVQDEGEIAALIGGERPLGSFGARVRLAYLIGLISKEEHEDLWAVNQIDGAFTRDMGEMSFEEQPVRAWCLEMRLPNKVLLSGEMRTPRKLFVFTIALLLRQLSMRIEQAEQRRPRPPEPFSLVEAGEETG